MEILVNRRINAIKLHRSNQLIYQKGKAANQYQ